MIQGGHFFSSNHQYTSKLFSYWRVSAPTVFRISYVTLCWGLLLTLSNKLGDFPLARGLSGGDVAVVDDEGRVHLGVPTDALHSPVLAAILLLILVFVVIDDLLGGYSVVSRDFTYFKNIELNQRTNEQRIPGLEKILQKCNSDKDT